MDLSADKPASVASPKTDGPAPATPRPAWLPRSLYPFTPRSFATPEGRLSYLDEGHGRPVLFVHGTPSYSLEFREVIRVLSPARRCLAPDHLGFGLSDKPADGAYRPEDHARRLRAFVEALDLKDLTLVVHDFGGPIGLPLALDLPSRVREVVVLNSWSWPSADDPAARKVDRLVRTSLGRFLYLACNASPRWLLPAAFGDRKKLGKDLHRAYLGPFSRREERHALYALALALVGSDPFYASLWERRRALVQPLRLVWGEKDPAFGPRHLARWREAFPKAEVTTLPGVGHFVAEEAPLAVVAAIEGR